MTTKLARVSPSGAEGKAAAIRVTHGAAVLAHGPNTLPMNEHATTLPAIITTRTMTITTLRGPLQAVGGSGSLSFIRNVEFL